MIFQAINCDDRYSGGVDDASSPAGLGITYARGGVADGTVDPRELAETFEVR
jgi:hypothetical protein